MTSTQCDSRISSEELRRSIGLSPSPSQKQQEALTRVKQLSRAVLLKSIASETSGKKSRILGFFRDYGPLGYGREGGSGKIFVVKAGDVIEPDELYSFKVPYFMFRGKLRPGESIMMRKGCLAEEGDLVQLANESLTIFNIVPYRTGIEYTAVCVGKSVPMELFNFRCEKEPKHWYHVEYVVNGEKRYSPWFSASVTLLRLWKF